MNTNKNAHLSESDIRDAIVSWLMREHKIAALHNNVNFSVDTCEGEETTVTADVCGCEDAPKAKRGRKAQAAKAEG